MGSDSENPWGSGKGNNGSPWGGGKNNVPPPDIDEMIKKSRQKIRMVIPGGMGGKGDKEAFFGIFIIFAIIFSVWIFSGFYQVQPDEQGVVLRFGKYTYTTGPGLHYHFPAPIEKAYTPNVMRENRIEIGFRSMGDGRRVSRTDENNLPQESLMLTGDENIVDIHYTVTWFIKSAPDYLFNVRDPEGTVRVAAESAMREVIGQMPIQKALTEGRRDIEEQTQSTLQSVLDEFGSGVSIKRVNLLKVDPPQQVVDAFNDVQRAKADRERMRNEAEAYRNDIIPKARGEAQRIFQGAEAYKAEVINRATGDATRFTSVYDAYSKAKDVTAKRLFLETMEEVMAKSNKIIIDSSAKGSSGVVPLLPLGNMPLKGGN